MKSSQFFVICVCALLGSLFGSWLALSPRTEAHAQTQPGSSRSRTFDTLTIPDGGLRLVDMRMRTLGYFGLTDNGLSLVLMGRNGTPSVTLEGGSGGQVIVGASGNSAGISVASQTGSTASLVSTNLGSRLELGKQGRTARLGLAEEASFTLPGRSGSPLFSIGALPQGCQVRLFNAAGKEVFDLSSNSESGRLKLATPVGGSQVEADGKGQLTIKKGGEVLWSAIKAPGSEEQKPDDAPPSGK